MTLTFALCTALMGTKKLTPKGLGSNPLIDRLSMRELCISIGSRSISMLEVAESLYAEVACAQLDAAANFTATQLLHVLSASIALFESKKPEHRDEGLDLLLSAVAMDAPANALIPSCKQANIFASLPTLLREGTTLAKRTPHAQFLHAFLYDIFHSAPQVLYKAFDLDKAFYENAPKETIFKITQQEAPTDTDLLYTVAGRVNHETPCAQGTTIGLVQLCREVHTALHNHYGIQREGVHFASCNRQIRDYIQKYILYFIEACFVAENTACAVYGTEMLAQYYAFLGQCVDDSTSASEALAFLKSFESKRGILTFAHVLRIVAQEGLIRHENTQPGNYDVLNFLARARGYFSSCKAVETPNTMTFASASRLTAAMLRLLEIFAVHLRPETTDGDFIRAFGPDDIAIRFLAFSTDDGILQSAFFLLAALARDPPAALRIAQKANDLRLFTFDSTKGIHLVTINHVNDANTPIRTMYADFSAECTSGRFSRTIGYLSLMRWLTISGNATQTFSFAKHAETKEMPNEQWGPLLAEQRVFIEFCAHIITTAKQHFLQQASLPDGMWIALAFVYAILKETIPRFETATAFPTLIEDSLPFTLVFDGESHTPIAAERGLQSVLSLLHALLENTENRSTKESIIATCTKTTEFRTRLVLLLRAQSPGLRRIAMKCFFTLNKTKHDETDLIAQWKLNGQLHRLTGTIRREIFAKPSLEFGADTLYALSGANPYAIHPTESPHADAIHTKTETLNDLLAICRKGGNAITRAVLGYFKENSRSSAALFGAASRVCDMLVHRHYPEYHAVCIETLYALLCDKHAAIDEIRPILEEVVTNSVNAINALHCLHGAEASWYLHLVAYLIRKDCVRPKFVPDVHSFITSLIEQTPALTQGLMRYAPLPEEGRPLQYDIAKLDRTVLFDTSATADPGIIESLTAENTILFQNEIVLALLRGWAMLLVEMLQKGTSIQSDPELGAAHLHLLWKGVEFVTKAHDRLPLGQETRNILAQAVRFCVEEMVSAKGFDALEDDTRKDFVLRLVRAVEAWVFYPLAQNAALMGLQAIVKHDSEPVAELLFNNAKPLTRGMHWAITTCPRNLMELSSDALGVLDVIVSDESIAPAVFANTSLVQEIVAYLIEAADTVLSNLFQEAIDGNLRKALESDETHNARQYLWELNGLCHTLTKHSELAVEQLRSTGVIRRIAQSKFFGMLRCETLLMLIDANRKLQNVLSGFLQPILRIFQRAGEAVEGTPNESICMLLRSAMVTMKPMNAILLRHSNVMTNFEQIERDFDNGVFHIHVDLLHLLSYFGERMDAKRHEADSVFDPADMQPIVETLVDAKDWPMLNFAEYSTVLSMLTRFVRKTSDSTFEAQKAPLPMLYALLTAAQKHLAIVFAYTEGPYKHIDFPERTHTLNLSREIIWNTLTVVLHGLRDHPSLSLQHLKSYTALLDRGDCIPVEPPVGRSVFLGSSMGDKEQYAFVWKALRSLGENCLQSAVFRYTFDEVAQKSINQLRLVLESVLREHKTALQ